MQIRIKGYTFSLSSPFTAGHRLTAGEAQALNDLRTENIQNNFRHKVNARVAGLEPGQLLPQADIDALQALLTQADQDYKFVEKGTRSRLGDIEREARSIAESRARACAATPEQIPALITEFAQLPAVIEEARTRVAARRSAIAGGMESL